MKKPLIKNIRQETVLPLAAEVNAEEGQVVSKTLVQNPAVGVTLFAFGQGGEISAHDSKGDAMVLILEGEANIQVGENAFVVKEGESLIMPAGIPHALDAQKPFKMMLTVIF